MTKWRQKRRSSESMGSSGRHRAPSEVQDNAPVGTREQCFRMKYIFQSHFVCTTVTRTIESEQFDDARDCMWKFDDAGGCGWEGRMMVENLGLH